jgi:hypothetical protein
MDPDQDPELGRKREHQQAKRLGWMSYSCVGSSHCTRLLRTFIFGDCQGSYRLSSQGPGEYHIICLRPTQKKILTHIRIYYISTKHTSTPLPEVPHRIISNVARKQRCCLI